MFIAVFPLGGVAERSNAAVLKTAEVARLPWVRIPPPPRLGPPAREASHLLHSGPDRGSTMTALSPTGADRPRRESAALMAVAAGTLLIASVIHFGTAV